MPEDLDDPDALTDPEKCPIPITNKKEFKAHMRLYNLICILLYQKI